MKLGILGGGQLGRMLWEASKNLPRLQPSPIFHDSASCPAAAAGAEIHVGRIAEATKLQQFFAGVDSYVFENEFLDVDAIEKASPAWKRPFPSLAGLRLAQDKLEQKKLFTRLKLPTPEFQEVTSKDLSRQLAEIKTKWPRFVLKTARMGYDGKGNFFCKNDSDAKDAIAFCEKAFAAGSRVYAEPLIDFSKEVALVSSQTYAGDFGYYPLIETQQKKGVCLLAFRALNEGTHEKQAAEIARTLAEELNLLGTFAVEFFITTQGELLVNEMAPRVHNSGHFSQTAAKSSQFEMHLKSYYLKNWDPQDFESAPAFAMINLLGPEGVNGPVKKPMNIRCYWYDKTSISPGRKLGHINAHSTQAEDLPALLQELKRQEQLWTESLQR